MLWPRRRWACTRHPCRVTVPRRSITTLGDLEDITSAWGRWYNTSRLMHRLGRRPPPKPKPTTTLTKATATRLPQSTLPGKALPDLLMLRNLAGMPPTVAAQ
jgi:hypothetical protein